MFEASRCLVAFLNLAGASRIRSLRDELAFGGLFSPKHCIIHSEDFLKESTDNLQRYPRTSIIEQEHITRQHYMHFPFPSRICYCDMVHDSWVTFDDGDRSVRFLPAQSSPRDSNTEVPVLARSSFLTIIQQVQGILPCRHLQEPLRSNSSFETSQAGLHGPRF